MNLRLDWCGYDAAYYAVRTWHYSRSMPTAPLVKIGVWEDGRFVGCVLFSRGATPYLGSPYGLPMTQVCELSRVALGAHRSPVSRIISVAIRMLRAVAPGLRLIVSFADPDRGHVGAIYQAGNWVYTGTSGKAFAAIDSQGRIWHPRQVSKTGIKPYYGIPCRVPKLSDCVKRPLPGKHRYLYPLDEEMKASIAALALPYPKRAISIGSDAPGAQPGEDGANPIMALNRLNTCEHKAEAQTRDRLRGAAGD